MIGNAVPIKLAEYVAKCLLSYIQERHQYPISSIPKNILTR
jgi:DNA (cytosine-5)-methyltransferase 1